MHMHTSSQNEATHNRLLIEVLNNPRQPPIGHENPTTVISSWGLNQSWKFRIVCVNHLHGFTTMQTHNSLRSLEQR